MQYDVIIVGGGAVGLATALQLKKQDPKLKVVLLEKEKVVANHQTGNNSNVIHSGVYYKPGSLKATNCITGYNMLLDFLRENEVPFNLCGKVIVATNEKELPTLNTIFERGQANGLQNLKKLTGDQVREHEPYVAGIAGIHVPQTGIVDYRVVAEKYAELFQKYDGVLRLGEKAVDVKLEPAQAVVVTDKASYTGKLVVNCGGLYADKLAKLTRKDVNFKIIPFRGEYYKLRKEKEYLCRTLIYPVPDPAFPFLGVHFTTMVGGGVECGPNAVLAFKREGYKKSDVSVPELAETLAWPGFQKVARKYWRTGLGEMHRSFSKSAFTKALQKLMPDIREEDLITGGAGVRAQACDRTGGLVDDFLILEDKQVINVCNAPSPAATSSLAIGKTVSDWARKHL